MRKGNVPGASMAIGLAAVLTAFQLFCGTIAVAETAKERSGGPLLPATPGTGSGASRSTTPHIPGALKPGSRAAPRGPMIAKPDYALRVDAQQELSSGRVLYRFLVENKSSTAGGSSKLTIRVGTPCPTNQWKYLKSYPVPALAGGASAKVPTVMTMGGAGFMVEQPYAGKGCHFEVAVSPPGLGDANPSNNTMHLYTKVLSLPDLKVGGGGDAMYVQNVGGGTTVPSTFHVHCKSLNPSRCCWKASNSSKCLMEADKDVSVPALKPKESFKVWGTIPPSQAAKQYWFMKADSKNDVDKSNENNNTWEN